MTIPAYDLSRNYLNAEIPGLIAIYTSADEKGRVMPVEVVRAISACRTLNAEIVAVELSDRVVIAAINGYEDTYVAAIGDPGIALPAVARSLQGRLNSRSVPDIRPGILPSTDLRKYIARCEGRIAMIFGERYAARLIAPVSPTISSGAVTVEDMGNLRRKLSAALGDCIDLPAVDICSRI